MGLEIWLLSKDSLYSKLEIFKVVRNPTNAFHMKEPNAAGIYHCTLRLGEQGEVLISGAN